MAKPKASMNDVPLPVWRELLAAAVDFKAARLWERWSDGHNFALVDEQMRPWFVSVLGASRQVFGLVLYRGENGLRFILQQLHELDEDGRDIMFLQDALMRDWGSKKFLRPEEITLLSQLGYAPKPRERAAWPTFRTHNPGLFPWTLNETEARELTRGLRATLACFALAEQEPDFFARSEEVAEVLPTVMMADALAGPLRAEQVEWRHWLVPTLTQPPAPQPAADWLAKLKALPLAPTLRVEFDIFHFSNPVAEGGRPYYPLTGMFVDEATGFVAAIDMAKPGEAWGEFVLRLWAKGMLSTGFRPVGLSIKRQEWLLALQPLALALGITLRLVEALPEIAEARAAMAQFAG